jgi:hypothetical protein
MSVNICSKCEKECEVITVEGYDIEEFWGAPVRRYYYDDVSDCCQEEVEDGDQDTEH